jgi:plastocyanin
MMRRGIVLGAAAVLLLAAGGCGDDDDDAGGDGGGATTLDVTAVDFAFEGLPEEITGGAVTVNLTNDGEADHEIAFVEIGDTDIDQFFEDFGPVINEGAAFPDYVEALVGANEAAAGESGTFTYTLPDGTYAVFCALTGTAEDPTDDAGEGTPHFVQGMQQVVTVTAGDGDLPDADGSITASDYTFDVDLSAGDTTINFVNDGPNDHFAGFDVFPDGTTVEEAEEAFGTFIALEDGQAPPDDLPEPEEFGFSGIASEGQSIQFQVPGGLEPGTYIFYCFMSDRAGGPPHAIGNQMFKAFVVE